MAVYFMSSSQNRYIYRDYPPSILPLSPIHEPSCSPAGRQHVISNLTRITGYLPPIPNPRLSTCRRPRYTGVMSVKHHFMRYLGILALLMSIGALLAACDILGSPSSIASGVTDVNGLARIESPAGAMDFQVSSGLTGEKLPGVRVSVAVDRGMRFMYAEDATGMHLPVAVPLAGDSTIRRLVMPPKSLQGYNIGTAAGDLDWKALQSLGALTEADMRSRLKSSDVSVLLYLYNPTRPLALTGAALEAYATPFDNVTVLRAGGEPADAELALIVVGMRREAYDAWSNLNIDRYLASRVGQPPDLDLRDDLAFRWAYPVFEVYPPDDTLDIGEGDSASLRIGWRSANPDPPPPWSFFISSDKPVLAVSPENFSLGPDQPPQEVTLTVDRTELEAGDYSATVIIQPFADPFGLIEQRIERVVTFTVAQKPPTPTPGPAPENMTILPGEPRIGDMLEISATGFKPGESVLVEMTGAERSLRDALPLADALGSFSYQVDLTGYPTGTYDLHIVGAESGITGTATITIQEPVPDATVASGELNVRYQPLGDAPVLEVLVQGDPVQIVSVNGDDSWVEVVSGSGTRGWVQTKLLQLNIDLSTVPWNPAYPAP
jgi:hypothetical protein